MHAFDLSQANFMQKIVLSKRIW